MATRLMGLGVVVFLFSAGKAPAQPKAPLPDPGTVQKFRNQTGKTLTFEVTGTTRGSVWGTGVYTDDSSLAAAAVHAGVLKDGQKGIVRVTILPDQGKYQGSEKNGVKTGNWSVHGGSFRFGTRGRLDATVRPDPGTLESFRAQTGNSFIFEITGKATAGGYGTDVYSSDTSLAKAAVHAGILKVGQKGRVKVTMLPGQTRYEGSTRNGVTTATWPGNWPASYRIAAVKK